MHKQSVRVDVRGKLVGVGSLHPARRSTSHDDNHFKLLGHLNGAPCVILL